MELLGDEAKLLLFFKLLSYVSHQVVVVVVVLVIACVLLLDTRVGASSIQRGSKMQMAFGATIEVLTSREFKVSGATGPCQSLGRRGLM